VKLEFQVSELEIYEPSAGQVVPSGSLSVMVIATASKPAADHPLLSTPGCTIQRSVSYLELCSMGVLLKFSL
jgi:hypothetical protein